MNFVCGIMNYFPSDPITLFGNNFTRPDISALNCPEISVEQESLHSILRSCFRCHKICYRWNSVEKFIKTQTSLYHKSYQNSHGGVRDN
jgi:hypothetical protein